MSDSPVQRTAETYCTCGHSASTHRDPPIGSWSGTTECNGNDCDCERFVLDLREESPEQYPWNAGEQHVK